MGFLDARLPPTARRWDWEMTNGKCGWQYIVNLGQSGWEGIYGGISLQPHYQFSSRILLKPREHVMLNDDCSNSTLLCRAISSFLDWKQTVAFQLTFTPSV